MIIDQATVDKIYNATKIEEVVSDFVTLKKRGVNYIGNCPFHNEKTPSFTVSPAKEIFKCFGCGKGGNAVHFIMEHESVSYVEALRYLAEKYHIEIEERELSPEEKNKFADRESMFLLNAYAQKYFTTILHQHKEGEAIGLSYFKERGFSADIIKKFQLGYCLDERDAFTQEALRNKYQKDFLIKTGLSIESSSNYLFDRFRGRVIFPVHTLSGKVVAFGGRALKTGEKTAKYLNSPESEVYQKKNELYGIFLAKNSIVKLDCCYLVEGYTDVMSMHQSGIENVVSSSGTALTVGQIQLIRRFTTNITLLFDGDSAGINASNRSLDLLLAEGMNVKVVSLPEGEDPDSFAKKQNSVDFIAYVENNQLDFIAFKTRHLLEEAGKDPIKKSLLITDIVKTVAVIPDNITRTVYIKECSKILDIEEKVLLQEVNKHRLPKGYKKALKKQGLKQETTKKTNYQAPVHNTNTDQEEINLLSYLVKHGDHIMCKLKDGDDVLDLSVASYIVEELQRDALFFSNPLHQKMIEETAAHMNDETWKSQRFFVNHIDVDISKLSAELIIEPYKLSKIHKKNQKEESEENKLYSSVTRLMFEYKNKVLLLKIQEIEQKIKDLQTKNNEEELEKLYIEHMQLNAKKNELSKALGERIILK